MTTTIHDRVYEPVKEILRHSDHRLQYTEAYLFNVESLMPSEETGTICGRTQWTRNLKNIEEQFRKTGAIHPDDLATLIDFVYAKNEEQEKRENGTWQDCVDDLGSPITIKEAKSVAQENIRHLKTEVSRYRREIEDLKDELQTAANVVEEAAGYAEMIRDTTECVHVRDSIDSWLLRNGLDQFVPGRHEYDSRRDAISKDRLKVQHTTGASYQTGSITTATDEVDLDEVDPPPF